MCPSTCYAHALSVAQHPPPRCAWDLPTARAAVARRRAAHLQRLLSSAAAHPVEAEGEVPTEQGSAQAAAGAEGATAKRDEPEASRGGEASPPGQDGDEQKPSPGAAAAAAAALISCSRSGRGKCARYHIAKRPRVATRLAWRLARASTKSGSRLIWAWRASQVCPAPRRPRSRRRCERNRRRRRTRR